MLIYKCDICQKEMKLEDNHGEMKITKNSFGFLKHQKVPERHESYYIFCDVCSENMWLQKTSLERSYREEKKDATSGQ